MNSKIFFAFLSSMAFFIQEGQALKERLSSESLKEFAKSLPQACRQRPFDFTTTVDCAKNHFTIDGKPINPRIIQDMTTWLSDKGNQILEVDLLNSQNSNKYFVQGYDVDKQGSYFSVLVEKKDNDQNPISSFLYKVHGVTQNGVWIVQVTEWGGGTGYFKSFLFFKIKEKSAFALNPDTEVLSHTGKRLVLEKLYQQTLGDRANVEVHIQGSIIELEVKDRTGKTTREKIKIIS